jgi:ubiquinol-cytochrome c reductase iron-sulfur subunit
MSGQGPDRRVVIGGAALAWLLVKGASAAESGEPILAYPGEPIRVDGLARGDWITATVEGDPVFIRRRTAAEIAAARATPLAELPDPVTDEVRAPDGEWLVVSGVCTHAGCQVAAGLGPYQGWQCFCHGSTYDLSGRVRSGPAKRNLPVVPHQLAGGAMTLSPIVSPGAA